MGKKGHFCVTRSQAFRNGKLVDLIETYQGGMLVREVIIELGDSQPTHALVVELRNRNGKPIPIKRKAYISIKDFCEMQRVMKNYLKSVGQIK